MNKFYLASMLPILAVMSHTQASVDWQAEEVIKWDPHSFEGHTEYRLIEEQADEQAHIVAWCQDGQASGLFYRGDIDLRETPMISWQWQVSEFPQVSDEQHKDSDDFAARIYVVREHSVLRWRTRALNYVWSQHTEVGEDWPNPFASQAHMVAVRQGSAADGEWQTETRDMEADFKRFHGEAPDKVNAIAIMTDCDNSRSSASAKYRSIRVHARDAE
ncbi:MAG: DUF3047 domain-containing protein [Idiomarina sp.]|nr:DUF3047 domain-containing protein [Idiomarina sp.]